jgi:hypothetical protein
MRLKFDNSKDFRRSEYFTAVSNNKGMKEDRITERQEAGIATSYGWTARVPFSGVGRELTTHVHLQPTSRMMQLYFHSPIRIHGIVLNYSSTGTTLP